MIKNFIILEDSSKFHFGGGQKISLEVAAILHKKYNLLLFDRRKGTLFQDKIRPYVKEVFPLMCYGKFKPGKGHSFNIGVAELLLTMPILLYNLMKILPYLRSREISKKNTILYATSKKSLLIAYLVHKIRGIDYVYHAHTINNRHSLLYRLLDIPLRQAKYVICVSEAVKRNIGLPRCRLLYNPVRVSLLPVRKTLSGKEHIVVASFSSLIELKGIEYFMQSHRYLRNGKKVSYRIYGEGPMKDTLSRHASESVVLKGFAADVNDILAKEIDITVVPSLIEESFGMIIAESFSNGIPVITTNIGAQAELVDDGHVGYQVPLMDARAIAEKIDYLVEHPEVYSALSLNARERARSYDAALFERKFLDLLGLDPEPAGASERTADLSRKTTSSEYQDRLRR